MNKRGVMAKRADLEAEDKATSKTKVKQDASKQVSAKMWRVRMTIMSDATLTADEVRAMIGGPLESVVKFRITRVKAVTE